MTLHPQEARERLRMIPQQLKLHIAGRGYAEPDHQYADGRLVYAHAVYQHRQGALREVFAIARGETADEAERRALRIVQNCDGSEA